MEQAQLLAELFDDKITKILTVLSNKPKDFYLKELSDTAKVPIATTFRIVQKLKQLNVITESQISKFKLYRLANNNKSRFLTEIFRNKNSPLSEFIETIKNKPEIEAVILHGDLMDNRANVLLIGYNIRSSEMDKIVEDIKNRRGFSISFVNLDPNQYRQMTAMGLYSGRKTQLFSK